MGSSIDIEEETLSKIKTLSEKYDVSEKEIIKKAIETFIFEKTQEEVDIKAKSSQETEFRIADGDIENFLDKLNNPDPDREAIRKKTIEMANEVFEKFKSQ